MLWTWKQLLLQKLALFDDPVDQYTLKDGIIFSEGRMWIGNNSALMTKLITAFHSSAIGGHPGIQATYQRLKKLFALSGLKQDVTNFVQQCTICQQAKHEHCKAPFGSSLASQASQLLEEPALASFPREPGAFGSRREELREPLWSGPPGWSLSEEGKRFDQYFGVASHCNFKELLLLVLAKLGFSCSSKLHCRIFFSAKWASRSRNVRLASCSKFRKLARGELPNGP